MHLASSAAHLSVLLRKARPAAALSSRGALFRRHRRALFRARGSLTGTLSRGDLGAMRLSLRCRGATPLSLFPVDPIVARAVRGACDLGRTLVTPVATFAALRKLSRRAPHRRFLRKPATASGLKRSEPLSRAAPGGVRGHPSAVRLHATHELGPVHLVSLHASVLHEPARAPNTLGAGKPFRRRTRGIRAPAVDARQRRHSHRVRPIGTVTRHLVRADVRFPDWKRSAVRFVLASHDSSRKPLGVARRREGAR